MFIQYTYIKSVLPSDENGVIMTTVLFYKVDFSKKWEQIVGLFSFLLKMPQGHGLYRPTQVVTLSREMGSRIKMRACGCCIYTQAESSLQC